MNRVVTICALAGLVSAGCDGAVVRDPDIGESVSVSAASGAEASLETPERGFILDVGPGALTSDVELTLNVREPTATALTALYELGPSGLVFAQPVQVRVRYTGSARQPTLHHREAGGDWEAIATAAEGDYFLGAISHFSDIELRDLRSGGMYEAPPPPTFPADCPETEANCETAGACSNSFCFFMPQSACHYCPSMRACTPEFCAEARAEEGCEPAGDPACEPVCLARDLSVRFCD